MEGYSHGAGWTLGDQVGIVDDNPDHHVGQAKNDDHIGQILDPHDHVESHANPNDEVEIVNATYPGSELVISDLGIPYHVIPLGGAHSSRPEVERREDSHFEQAEHTTEQQERRGQHCCQ